MSASGVSRPSGGANSISGCWQNRGGISGQAVFEAEVLRTLCENGSVRTGDSVSKFCMLGDPTSSKKTSGPPQGVSPDTNTFAVARDSGIILWL
jgi:hypothetical protein